MAGNYEVLISDANGCHLGIPAQIDDAERLFFDINLGGDLRTGDSVVVCQGQVVELNAQNPGMSINWYRNGTELPHYRNMNTVETDTVGIYTLLVRNPTGCVATDTFNLKNNQYALKADFLIPTQAFVGDTIVALDITKPIPDYTDWFLPPTARVMSIAKDKISFIPTTDGEYRVLMIAKSGECENFKVKNIEIFEKGKVDSTGQDYDYDNHDILEVIVFPNPSSGRFSVSVSLNKLTSSLVSH